jgi:hypothetical protein
MHATHTKRKENQMRIELNSGAVRLGPNQTLKVVDGAGSTVCALEGSVWITEENQLKDIVLQPGGCYRRCCDRQRARRRSRSFVRLKGQPWPGSTFREYRRSTPPRGVHGRRKWGASSRALSRGLSTASRRVMPLVRNLVIVQIGAG